MSCANFSRDTVRRIKTTPPASMSWTENTFFAKSIPTVDTMLMGLPLFEKIVLATQSWHSRAASGRGSPLHSLGGILKGSFAVGTATLLTVCTMSVASAQSLSGESHADALLSKDITRTLLTMVKCRSVDSIVREELPADYSPPRIPGPSHSGPTNYERWTASGCGQTSVFLVELWKAESGGSMFGVIPMALVKGAS
jgi:hypothetical protein